MHLTVMLRIQSSQPFRGLLVLCVLALSAAPACGIDLGHWARYQQEHRDWTSVEFRDPITGLFLAARAGTEDRRTGTTLTFTMAPAQGCAADTVLIRKTATPVSVARDKRSRVTMRVDGLAPRQLSARLVAEPGDLFVFVKVLDALSADSFRNHRVLEVMLPNGYGARFSLAGFEDAWAVAEAVCKSFLLP